MKIVVHGAGVVGASIAWHLARRGCRDVVVIDRAPEPGGGSTAKATGGFRAQFDSEINVRLSLLSREKLRTFEAETGVDPGYRPYGYLFLATTGAALDELRRAQEIQHACGLAEARIVTADEARTLNPAIAGPLAGAAFCPTDGFIRPMNIQRGYMEAAQRLGVAFRFGVEREDGDVFVNAKGPWAGAPVTPLRRNVAATIETNVLPDTMPMTIWSEDWFHLRVRDGRVLLLWPDDPPLADDAWLAEVLRLTRERVPVLRDVPVDFTWSGFYEMSPDEHALLGRIRDNEYVAIGSSGHGVMHAPALGQLLAEIIVDGEASLDVSALRPDRFGPVRM
ncbi:MAG TPA: FAD-dependent oxidoreductase [Thermoanaerobaculia bacterium]|jgi:sarcosine oxidase subunit beta